MLASAAAAAHAIFVDAHNTGYYINAYTTKLNPTMENVLRRLLDGVRRLQDEWAQRATDAQPSDAPSSKPGVEKNREAFRRTIQLLSRFETSFRRATWKSGSELLFPILF